jgi:hypothetical protein
VKIKLAFSRITWIDQEKSDFLGAPFGAVIDFDNGYYWEIPANHHDAIKIAELAEDMAGQNIDGIVFFGEYAEMAIVCREGRAIGTSFGAAFMARKVAW